MRVCALEMGHYKVQNNRCTTPNVLHYILMHHSIVPSHVYKMYVICMLEMQQYQYIDISPYRDALGSDTVRYI